MSNITAIIPTSPIRKHPDTSMVEETIASIRHHHPTAEIILQIDGVRKEQEYLTDQYNEYKTRILWKCLHEYTNVLPVVFDDHQHQSGMLRATLPLVKTPLLLYMEGDTPLVTDLKIDWERCIKFIFQGKANTIRFHFENVIPDPHKELMLGSEDHFLRTIQWSQRPHLSTTLYYKDQIMSHFPETSRTFIEDLFHGVVMNDYESDGMLGWFKHRLWIYHPPKGIKRSYNLDGRGDERKYEMSFE